jgi:hypothetical protein
MPATMLAVICWASVLSLFVEYLSVRSSIYESSYRFEIEIWSYTKRVYNIDEDQFLNICVVFQNAYNIKMYSAII